MGAYQMKLCVGGRLSTSDRTTTFQTKVRSRGLPLVYYWYRSYFKPKVNQGISVLRSVSFDCTRPLNMTLSYGYIVPVLPNELHTLKIERLQP